MNKRKILLLASTLMMVAVLAVGGTLAYFTDTDNAVNTFTVGNVDIIQNEQERVENEDGSFTSTLQDYTNNQMIFPVVGDKGAEADGYHHGKNYVDKIVTVTVKETSQPAYIRTHIAFPDVLDNGANKYMSSDNILHWNGGSATDTKAAYVTGDVDGNHWYWDANMTVDWPGNGGPWNTYEITVGGVPYTVYVATHKEIVDPGETTAPNLMGVYLDSLVDYKNGSYVDKNGTSFSFPKNADGVAEFNILVLSEAVQAEGFADAKTALDTAFGAVGTYCPFAGGTLIDTTLE